MPSSSWQTWAVPAAKLGENLIPPQNFLRSPFPAEGWCPSPLDLPSGAHPSEWDPVCLSLGSEPAFPLSLLEFSLVPDSTFASDPVLPAYSVSVRVLAVARPPARNEHLFSLL